MVRSGYLEDLLGYDLVGVCCLADMEPNKLDSQVCWQSANTRRLAVLSIPAERRRLLLNTALQALGTRQDVG